MNKKLMRENNPGLRVSVWKESIACVTRAMRETWQAWFYGYYCKLGTHYEGRLLSVTVQKLQGHRVTQRQYMEK